LAIAAGDFILDPSAMIEVMLRIKKPFEKPPPPSAIILTALITFGVATESTH
jgi:hypothetical protein